MRNKFSFEKAIKGFIVSSIVFLVMFMFIEITLRITLRNRPNRWINYQDEILGWAHYPNGRGIIRAADFTVNIAINSDGLRDREFTVEKPGNTFRAIILGDSYVQAMGVNIEDSFQKITEKRLNNELGKNNLNYEVMDAGVGGYSTDQELLFFRYRLKKYGPDLVLLAFYIGNDILGNGEYAFSKLLHRPIRKPYFVLSNHKLVLRNFPYKKPDIVARNSNLLRSSGLKIQRDILEHSIVYRVTRDFLEKFPIILALFTNIQHAVEPLSANEIKLMTEDTPELEESWEITRQLLLELNKEVKDTGSEFAVIIIPRKEQIELSPYVSKEQLRLLDETERKIFDFLNTNGIKSIDLLGLLRKDYLRNKKEFTYHDGHFNILGHRVVGDIVFSWLVNNKMIKIK